MVSCSDVHSRSDEHHHPIHHKHISILYHLTHRYLSINIESSDIVHFLRWRHVTVLNAVDPWQGPAILKINGAKVAGYRDVMHVSTEEDPTTLTAPSWTPP